MECVIHNIKIKYEDGELWLERKYKHKIVWYLLKGSIHRNGYREVKINKKIYQYHRIIFKIFNKNWDITDNSKNNLIDHIDRNRLNNNIDNLRVVTNQENCFNTNCKGYSWHKRNNKWCVAIKLNGKSIWGGYFINEEDAKNKYSELKKQYHKIN